MSTVALNTPLPVAVQDSLAPIGYSDEAQRAATVVIVDQNVGHVSVTDTNVEVLPLQEALKTHDWVQDLLWSLISPDENDDVRRVAESTEPVNGHFIHVKAGADVKLPLQAFTVLETPQGRQHVHNLTVIEEGARVEVVSGDAVAPIVRAGEHVSISETFIRKGAVYKETSLEHWGGDMQVRSYSRTLIEDDATVTTTSIALHGIKHHQDDAKTVVGRNATYNAQSVVYAPEGTERVSISELELLGDGASAENLARMVAAGGRIEHHSKLVGTGTNTKGYLGCDGLKIDDQGYIESVPSLRAINDQSQLSHEASIGTIDQEKLGYLMATGLDEEAARNLIISGFLDLEEGVLPESAREQVRGFVAQARSGAL